MQESATERRSLRIGAMRCNLGVELWAPTTLASVFEVLTVFVHAFSNVPRTLGRRTLASETQKLLSPAVVQY